MISEKLSAIATLDIKCANYCYIISGIIKSEAINLMLNINLTKNIEHYKNIKHKIYYYMKKWANKF